MQPYIHTYIHTHIRTYVLTYKRIGIFELTSQTSKMIEDSNPVPETSQSQVKKQFPRYTNESTRLWNEYVGDHLRRLFTRHPRMWTCEHCFYLYYF